MGQGQEAAMDRVKKERGAGLHVRDERNIGPFSGVAGGGQRVAKGEEVESMTHATRDGILPQDHIKKHPFRRARPAFAFNAA